MNLTNKAKRNAEQEIVRRGLRRADRKFGNAYETWCQTLSDAEGTKGKEIIARHGRLSREEMREQVKELVGEEPMLLRFFLAEAGCKSLGDLYRRKAQ